MRANNIEKPVDFFQNVIERLSTLVEAVSHKPWLVVVLISLLASISSPNMSSNRQPIINERQPTTIRDQGSVDSLIMFLQSGVLEGGVNIGNENMVSDLVGVTCDQQSDDIFSQLIGFEGAGTKNYYCEASFLTSEGSRFDLPLLLNVNPEGKTEVLAIIPEGEPSSVRATVRIVPMSPQGFNLDSNTYTLVDVLKTLQGSTVIETKIVDGLTVSSTTTTHQDENFATETINYLNESIGPDTRQWIKDNTSETHPLEVSMPSVVDGRPIEGKYEFRVIDVAEFDDASNLIVQEYWSVHPELDGLMPNKIIQIDNPGYEQVNVLDFGSGTSIHSEEIASIYNFFINFARMGNMFEYGDLRIETQLAPVINTTIGLVGSDLGYSDGLLDATGVGYTNWSVSENRPNSTYIKVVNQEWIDQNFPGIESPMLNANIFNSSSLITEICQSVNRAKFTQGGSVKVNYRDTLKAQEVYCGSMQIAIDMKTLGWSYTDYVSTMKKITLYIPGNPEEQMVPLILPREKWWKIPVLTKSLISY